MNGDFQRPNRGHRGIDVGRSPTVAPVRLQRAVNANKGGAASAKIDMTKSASITPKEGKY